MCSCRGSSGTFYSHTPHPARVSFHTLIAAVLPSRHTIKAGIKMSPLFFLRALSSPVGEGGKMKRNDYKIAFFCAMGRIKARLLFRHHGEGWGWCDRRPPHFTWGASSELIQQSCAPWIKSVSWTCGSAPESGMSQGWECCLLPHLTLPWLPSLGAGSQLPHLFPVNLCP